MRKFKDSFGDELDLDDESTYDHLPKTERELDNLMFQEIGKYYCYVKYFHPNWHKPQEERVERMIKYYCDCRNNYGNMMWFKERVFLFQDETENMC